MQFKSVNTLACWLNRSNWPLDSWSEDSAAQALGTWIPIKILSIRSTTSDTSLAPWPRTYMRAHVWQQHADCWRGLIHDKKQLMRFVAQALKSSRLM